MAACRLAMPLPFLPTIPIIPSNATIRSASARPVVAPSSLALEPQSPEAFRHFFAYFVQVVVKWVVVFYLMKYVKQEILTLLYNIFVRR